MEFKKARWNGASITAFFNGFLIFFCLPLVSAVAAGSDGFRHVSQSECGAEDIRDHFVGDLAGSLRAFFQVPRVQGYFDLHPEKDVDVGMCYAVAAADLLSIEFHQPVSALSVFFEYDRDRAQSLIDQSWRFGGDILGPDASPIMDGGFSYWALVQVIPNDETDSQNPAVTCPEQLEPSSHSPRIDSSILKTLNDPREESLHNGVDLPSALGYLIKVFNYVEANHRLPRYRSTAVQELHDMMSYSPLIKIFRGLGKTDHERQQTLEAIMLKDIEMNSGLYKLLTDLSRASCSGRDLHLPAPNQGAPNLVPKHFDKDSANLLASINQLLTKRHRAMAVLYDSAYTRQNKPMSWLGGGTHWSVIVGRRWNGEKNGGTCEYRIRDSLFGYDGSKYRTDTVSFDKTDGTFWVSDETLWQMTSSIAYISKSNDEPLVEK